MRRGCCLLVVLAASLSAESLGVAQARAAPPLRASDTAADARVAVVVGLEGRGEELLCVLAEERRVQRAVAARRLQLAHAEPRLLQLVLWLP